MDFWVLVLSRSIEPAKALFFVAPLYVLVEVLLPQERVSWRSRLQSAVFSLAAAPITAFVYVAFALLWSSIGVNPLLTLNFAGWLAPIGWVGAAMAAILAAIVGDFFFYWMHRAQHAWLWRFHAVHHSIEELSAVSGYHHASEEVFRIVLYVIPMSLLLNMNSGAAPFIVGLLVSHHTYWVHSSTRLHWGPLRAIFDDNRFHRIHHSKNPAHFNKNFGGFSTIWDRLFGTAYWPAKGEWPAVGLDDYPEPQSVADYFGKPFRSFAPQTTNGHSTADQISRP